MRYSTLILLMLSSVNGADYILEMQTVPWCSGCNIWYNNEAPKLNRMGLKVQKVNPYSTNQVPVFRLKIKNNKGVYVPIRRNNVDMSLIEWIGVTPADQMISAWQNDKTNRSKTWTFDLGNKSDSDLAKELKEGQTQTVMKEVTRVVPITKRVNSLPKRVNTPWGRINLETYSRPGCNCRMCQHIRGLQAQYRQPQFVTEYRTETTTVPVQVPLISQIKEAAQEQTPKPTVLRALALARIDSEDVLLEIGCGDASVLIEAVQSYDCSGIGIEIDEAKASIAKKKIKEAGLEDKIQINPGGCSDALEYDYFDTDATVAFVYLYPKLLEKLSSRLRLIDRVVSPFHQVPDLPMKEYYDVWLYER